MVRYAAGIVKWTKNELDEIERRIRKVMTMIKNYTPKGMPHDIDRIYVSKTTVVRELIEFKMCLNVLKNSL